MQAFEGNTFLVFYNLLRGAFYHFGPGTARSPPTEKRRCVVVEINRPNSW